MDRSIVALALAQDDDVIPGHMFDQVLEFCASGSLREVERLAAAGADLRYQSPETGKSTMMIAAAAGHRDIVEFLLRRGVPWNAQDACERCAGDHATIAGQTEVLTPLHGLNRFMAL
jgi:ankyrin repeat protein